MTDVFYNHLYNFSASFSGGGYKRLYEYAKDLNHRGGAHFIIHPNCESLTQLFRNNCYHVAIQSPAQRIFRDCGYLKPILKNIGVPDLYYSYGIPIYSKVGLVNWFHLSNVLPLVPRGISIGPLAYLKVLELGRRIRNNLYNASVISAESQFSLRALGSESMQRHFLSVNGADDELELLAGNKIFPKSNIAVVIGTYRYKALQESYRVFSMLSKASKSELKLVIIGSKKDIPAKIAGDKNVVIRGLISQKKVVECLQDAKFYISTTQVENSYNAASEGVFFAEESYISNIGPHQELLSETPTELVSIPGVHSELIKIKRENINGNKLQTWAQVIEQMMMKIQRTIPNEK